MTKEITRNDKNQKAAFLLGGILIGAMGVDIITSFVAEHNPNSNYSIVRRIQTAVPGAYATTSAFEHDEAILAAQGAARVDVENARATATAVADGYRQTPTSR